MRWRSGGIALLTPGISNSTIEHGSFRFSVFNTKKKLMTTIQALTELALEN